ELSFIHRFAAWAVGPRCSTFRAKTRTSTTTVRCAIASTRRPAMTPRVLAAAVAALVLSALPQQAAGETLRAPILLRHRRSAAALHCTLRGGGQGTAPPPLRELPPCDRHARGHRSGAEGELDG